jgi:adenylate kinase
MILFFGPPGSGKSVQGELLVERNDWQWLSTGSIFRSSENPEIQKRLATGELIDDDLTNKVLDEALNKIGNNTMVILDGYPRNIDQARWLIDYLPSVAREIECVIEFKVPEEEIIRRLSDRGRAEDVRDVIERRLEIYNEKTNPVLEFLRAEGIVVQTVNGTGLVKEVHERIQGAVEACIQK